MDINCSNIFSDPSPRVMQIQTKINKWNLIKLKTAKEAILRNPKRQLTVWEKIFANEATDKRLISKIYKQLMQLNIKKDKLLEKYKSKLLRGTTNQNYYEGEFPLW